MKLRLLAAAFAAMTLTAGAASAQDTTSDKGKLSYAIGYDMGNNIAELVANGEAVDINTVVKALNDAYAKKPPSVDVAQLRTAVQGMQQRQVAKAKAAFDKASTENKSKSDAYLAQNKGKPGVKSLPKALGKTPVQNSGRVEPTQSTISP